MKARALLFGLNYAHIPNSALQGCINDVRNMQAYLETLHIPCEVHTDDTEAGRAATSALGLTRKLYEAAVQTYKEDIDFLWIHFSGHGSWTVDRSGDERDGRDECLVPSDYPKAGFIPDDVIINLFQLINPKTRVVCIFDCCHSGTIGDVKYSWEGPRRAYIENIACKATARILTLSGCMDVQTSADAYDVVGDKQYTGAMTSSLLHVLKTNPNVGQNAFALLAAIREKLKAGGFEQVTKMCSSYNLTRDQTFLPKV